jgi:ABC-type amino acid transport substrate-binding protein
LRAAQQLLAFLALALVVVLSQVTIGLGAGTLAEIKQRGTLRLCAADWPYLVKDPKTGQWVGWDFDLANMYAARLGVKVAWVDSSWGNIVPSLVANKCDIAWGALRRTPERAQVLDFSQPVHKLGLVVVVRENDNRFKSYEDLNKPGIVFSELADIGEVAAKKYFPKAKVRIIESDNVVAQTQEVIAGRADANVNDMLIARDLVKKNAGVKIVPGPVIEPSEVSFAVRKGDKELLDSVNKFVASVWADGTMKTLAKKYDLPLGFLNQ